MLFFILLQLQYEAIHSATTYLVGDDIGWDPSIDLEGWTRGKNFHAGDFPKFKYDDERIDVAVVNKEGHDTCTVNEGAQVFDSGDDTISLAFGANYFIDSESDLCAVGMKMAINATKPPSSIMD
ncbi:hypothetical protein CRYUN_Cryun10bG0156000 [Craigia yunnanensis]